MDHLPVYPYYKAAMVFDPRQLAILSHDIGDYSAITSLKDPTHTLLENLFHKSEFWKGMETRFPNLAAIASQTIWMPVASVDVERSFSLYKHILCDGHESLKVENDWSSSTIMVISNDIFNQYCTSCVAYFLSHFSEK